MEEEKIWSAILDLFEALDIDDPHLAEDVYSLITLEEVYKPKNSSERLAAKLMAICKNSMKE